MAERGLLYVCSNLRHVGISVLINQLLQCPHNSTRHKSNTISPSSNYSGFGATLRDISSYLCIQPGSAGGDLSDFEDTCNTPTQKCTSKTSQLWSPKIPIENNSGRKGIMQHWGLTEAYCTNRVYTCVCWRPPHFFIYIAVIVVL